MSSAAMGTPAPAGVPEQGVGMSSCGSCGAPILWAVTESGRRMPVDAKPSPDGNLHLLYAKHRLQVEVAPERPGIKYLSHFVTCPEADKHRKARG